MKQVRAASELLLTSVMVPESSVVTVIGPVEPNSLFKEDSPKRTALKLRVPRSKGTYYFFFIDDVPGAMFAHPVRYAWVDLDRDRVVSVGATFPATLYSPRGKVVKLKTRGRRFILEGVTFQVMSGA